MPLFRRLPRRSSDRSRAAPFTLSGQLPMCRRMAVEDVLSDCDPKGRTAGAHSSYFGYRVLIQARLRN